MCDDESYNILVSVLVLPKIWLGCLAMIAFGCIVESRKDISGGWAVAQQAKLT